MTFSIEKILRVYNDREGVYIEIKPNPDFPDSALTISTGNHKKSEDWYGKFDISINSKEEAIKLAKALLEMSELIE